MHSGNGVAGTAGSVGSSSYCIDGDGATAGASVVMIASAAAACIIGNLVGSRYGCDARGRGLPESASSRSASRRHKCSRFTHSRSTTRQTSEPERLPFRPAAAVAVASARSCSATSCAGDAGRPHNQPPTPRPCPLDRSAPLPPFCDGRRARAASLRGGFEGTSLAASLTASIGET